VQSTPQRAAGICAELDSEDEDEDNRATNSNNWSKRRVLGFENGIKWAGGEEALHAFVAAHHKKPADEQTAF